MTGYTKGPWTVTISEHVRVRPVGSNSPICGVHKRGKYTGSLNLPETEANARLIAAAPELVEALDALRKQALQSELNSHANEWGMEAIEKATAALEKAGVV